MTDTKETREQSAHLNMRVSPDWLKRIDAWRLSQPVPPARADVIRIAVDKFLAEMMLGAAQ